MRLHTPRLRLGIGFTLSGRVEVNRAERFEVLCRTLSSGLPYVSVVDSWHTYDGAVALALVWAESHYPLYSVKLYGDNVVVRAYDDEGSDELGELVAQLWVWENPEIED